MLVRPLAPLDFFVVLVMLSIGLRVSGGELVDVLRNRALFFRTLLANCVFIPGLGFLLVKIFPLTPVSAYCCWQLSQEHQLLCNSRAWPRRAWRSPR